MGCSPQNRPLRRAGMGVGSQSHIIDRCHWGPCGPSSATGESVLRGPMRCRTCDIRMGPSSATGESVLRRPMRCRTCDIRMAPSCATGESILRRPMRCRTCDIRMGPSCATGENLLQKDRDRRGFGWRVLELPERFGFKVHAVVLMNLSPLGAVDPVNRPLTCQNYSEWFQGASDARRTTTDAEGPTWMLDNFACAVSASAGTYHRR